MLTEMTYGFRRPRPLLQTGGSAYLDGVLASTVFDLDATIAASYSGTGVTWANLVAAPADGAAQTDYDFYRGDGATGTTYPTFNGSGAAAYWSFDGGDFFKLKSGVNPAFLAGLHKTSGGSDWWIAFAHNSVDGTWGGSTFFGTVSAFSAGHHGMMFRPTAGESFDIPVVTNGGSATAALPVSLFATGNYLTIFSHSHSTNTTTWWNNSSSGTHISHTFYANTNNATGTATIGARPDNSSPLPAGNHLLYSFAMGNEYLDDTKAAALITALQVRHGRSYV